MSTKKHKCGRCSTRYKTRKKAQECCITKGFQWSGFVKPADAPKGITYRVIPF